MLEIKQKFSLKLPSLEIRSEPIAFEPAVVEEDELIQEIDNETSGAGSWQLVERPDPNELLNYLDRVVEDVQSDPEWVWLNDEA